MNKQMILTSCMSALALTTSTNLKAEWQNWAIGSAVAAGVGGLIYWTMRPASPEKVTCKAEAYYTAVVCSNESLFQAYQQSPDVVSEEIILLVTEKGRLYRTTHWFVSDDNYISSDCAHHAPLVRGYAALLEESANLLSHHNKLITCFGSAQAARTEYYNFDNLETYAHALQIIAEKIELHGSFMIARDAFNMHRANIRKHEETQRHLADMRREMAHLNRKQKMEPTQTTVSVVTVESTNAKLYKYLTESI